MRKLFFLVTTLCLIINIPLLKAQDNTNVSTHPVSGLNIEMVFVKGGTFTMGCTKEQGGDCEIDEKPSHFVSLSDYFIGKYEVTQKQWKTVMGSNPSSFKNCDNCPVEQVSWNDIQEFIIKLNATTGKTYILPTEAQWEYAARGGATAISDTVYKYSGSNTVDEVAWYDNNSKKTHRVGQKSPNKLGIYDMSGNVWEWCNDWKRSYQDSTNIIDYTGSPRVLRGGSWHSRKGCCRVSHRYSSAPVASSRSIGFRLAIVP